MSGSTYNITIGNGGIGGPYNTCGVGYSGYDGQSSTFNGNLIAYGGSGGTGLSPTNSIPSLNNSNYSNECTSCVGSNGSVINWKYSTVSNIPSYIPSSLLTEIPDLAPGGSYGIAGRSYGSGGVTQPTTAGDGTNGYCIIRY